MLLNVSRLFLEPEEHIEISREFKEQVVEPILKVNTSYLLYSAVEPWTPHMRRDDQVSIYSQGCPHFRGGFVLYT